MIDLLFRQTYRDVKGLEVADSERGSSLLRSGSIRQLLTSSVYEGCRFEVHLYGAVAKLDFSTMFVKKLFVRITEFIILMKYIIFTHQLHVHTLDCTNKCAHIFFIADILQEL